ncbi:MAG: hypothetical protein AAB365_03485 [Patescibacteria group bacterium]
MSTSPIQPTPFPTAVANVWMNFLERAAKTHPFPWFARFVDDGLGKGKKQFGMVDADGVTVAFTTDYAQAQATADFANAEFA